MNKALYESFLLNNCLIKVKLMEVTLCEKVTEMDAEYFPPKEDVILQNESPTDLYILVSGAVVSKLNHE